MKKFFTSLLILSATLGFAQLEPGLDVPAQNVGGKSEFEHVFQTQLIYPENLLASKTSTEVTVYFVVATDGSINNVLFKQAFDPAFEKEARRLLRFYVFEPAVKDGGKIISQSWLTFRFNAEGYKKICKNRGFTVPAYKLPADTSFIVYQRADSSPDYYKGEEALADFIVKNLDYPPIAVRQNIQGTVVLNFIVEPNGCPSNIAVLKGVNAGCTEEAIRVLRLTRWKPATKDGQLVRYRMTYPIVFNLNNVNRDNTTSEQK